MNLASRKIWILPVIVISQFFCITLWFAGNGVMNDLSIAFNLSHDALSHLTSAVQLGFITGTFVFALMTISDRYSPTLVFCFCAFFGAAINMGIIWEGNGLTSLLMFRFFTGFFLAGIYPVGMKIAADHFQKGLGKSLGYLVGALVLGTALPHLLKDFNVDYHWSMVIISTSIMALIGGTMMVLFVPEGPHRKPSTKLDITILFKVFKNKNFRSAAFGYFGHMWELYAFWTFVPLMLIQYSEMHDLKNLNIPLLSFTIIAIGGIACVMGGYISTSIGAKKTAFYALLMSCLCCLFSPLFFMTDSKEFFIGLLIFWGMVVIADSPLFSTLVAHNASPETKGTALTIVNCIGFSITIVSIQIINILSNIIDPSYLYVVLALGPILGLLSLRIKTD